MASRIIYPDHANENAPRANLLLTLRATRPKNASSAIISYDTSTMPGPKRPNVLLNVDTGKYEPRQDEYRLLGETLPFGTPEPGTPLRITPKADGNGVTTAYDNGPSRHIQWLDHFGKQAIRLWKSGRTPDALNTLLPALTETNLSAPYRQAVLTLLHLDRTTSVLTTTSITQLQTRLEQEPELGEVVVTIAEGNYQTLGLEDIIRVARTVVTK